MYFNGIPETVVVPTSKSPRIMATWLSGIDSKMTRPEIKTSLLGDDRQRTDSDQNGRKEGDFDRSFVVQKIAGRLEVQFRFRGCPDHIRERVHPRHYRHRGHIILESSCLDDVVQSMSRSSKAEVYPSPLAS